MFSYSLLVNWMEVIRFFSMQIVLVDRLERISMLTEHFSQSRRDAKTLVTKSGISHHYLSTKLQIFHFLWYIYYLSQIVLRNRPQGVENKPSRPLRQFKPHAERLVVKWVTISESRLLIVFCFFGAGSASLTVAGSLWLWGRFSFIDGGGLSMALGQVQLH
jgi:hypothetical protein